MTRRAVFVLGGSVPAPAKALCKNVAVGRATGHGHVRLGAGSCPVPSVRTINSAGQTRADNAIGLHGRCMKTPKSRTPGLDRGPGGEERDRREERRRDDQLEGRVVDAEVVGDAVGGHPGLALHELHLGHGPKIGREAANERSRTRLLTANPRSLSC